MEIKCAKSKGMSRSDLKCGKKVIKLNGKHSAPEVKVVCACVCVCGGGLSKDG